MVHLVVNSAVAAVGSKGGEVPAKVESCVAPLKNLKLFRPGIQLAFSISSSDGLSVPEPSPQGAGEEEVLVAEWFPKAEKMGQCCGL